MEQSCERPKEVAGIGLHAEVLEGLHIQCGDLLHGRVEAAVQPLQPEHGDASPLTCAETHGDGAQVLWGIFAVFKKVRKVLEVTRHEEDDLFSCDFCFKKCFLQKVPLLFKSFVTQMVDESGVAPPALEEPIRCCFRMVRGDAVQNLQFLLVSASLQERVMGCEVSGNPSPQVHGDAVPREVVAEPPVPFPARRVPAASAANSAAGLE